jgi:outer membrane protein OmpA-like peptidoglycan-associated protein
VKVRALLLFIPFAGVAAPYMLGQVDCTTSTKLVCQFPVSAETLALNTLGEGAVAPAQSVATPINGSIAAQLTQLPIPSATVGVVSLQQKGSDVGVPFENLGPVLSDRPDTIGKGHIFIGFNYQYFNFNALDGVDMNALKVGFAFPATIGNDSVTYYGEENNKVKFQLAQYIGVLTYGLTKTMDMSIIVPFNSVKLSATASGFQAYFFDNAKNTYTNISDIYSSGTAVSTVGSASGLGDITISLKKLIAGSEGSRTAIASGASFRFPSGDALNYLGSGAIGGNFYGLFEYRARVAPHLKLGYQWNGTSQLLNLNSPPTTRLPGGLQYDAGADIKLTRSVTFAADLLGSQFVNAPSFVEGVLPLDPTPNSTNGGGPGSGIPQSNATVTGLNNTYTTVNVSAGLKWSPLPHFLLFANVLMQTNNVGLRSDPVPLFGAAYNFKNRGRERPVTLNATASPVSVFAGEPITLTASAENLNPKLKVVYSWTGDELADNGSTAVVSTASLPPGTYSARAQVKMGKPGREGLEAGQSAVKTVTFSVKAFEPPTVACSVTPASINSGETATIKAVGVSPQNRPLTYRYEASAGTISGNSAMATFNSTGVPTGSVEVTCSVADDKGQAAMATSNISILEPYVPPVPHTQALCEISFEKDNRRPTRVDNEAKACLDEMALNLQRQPDAKAIVVGEADAREKTSVEDIAAERAANTKKYLVTEKGIDATRVSLRKGATDERKVENYLVPAGANFDSDVKGTTPLDENIVRFKANRAAREDNLKRPKFKSE